MGVEVGDGLNSLVSIGGWKNNGFILNLPDVAAILSDGSIRGELAGFDDTKNSHLIPFLYVFVDCVNSFLGIDVGVEIEASNVVIATVSQVIKNGVNNLSVTEEARLNSIENTSKSATNVASLAFSKLFSDPLDTGDSFTEDEHIFFTNFLSDLNIGTVHSSNDERSIHDKFHVGSTRSLGTSGGNMLGNFRGWDNNLSRRYVVVGQENNLQKISDSLIIVNFVHDSIDKFDLSLSSKVTRGSLSSNHDYSSLELLSSLVNGSVQDCQISVNNIKNIHELSLVLMNSLNLNIINCINRNIIPSSILYPSLELLLVVSLDSDDLLLESRVSGIRSELSKVLERSDPLIHASHMFRQKAR